MKITLIISLFIILHLSIYIRASPPKGGIGDGYIYPVSKKGGRKGGIGDANIYHVTKLGTKHKDSKTYYAKPLHPPRTKPKPVVYKVIIHDQPPQQAAQQEQTFKIIHLPKQRGGVSAGGGHGAHHGKSVKVLKIIKLPQQQGGHGGGWSK